MSDETGFDLLLRWKVVMIGRLLNVDYSICCRISPFHIGKITNISWHLCLLLMTNIFYKELFINCSIKLLYDIWYYQWWSAARWWMSDSPDATEVSTHKLTSLYYDGAQLFRWWPHCACQIVKLQPPMIWKRKIYSELFKKIKASHTGEEGRQSLKSLFGQY